MKILVMAPNFQLMETCKTTITGHDESVNVLLGDLQDGLRIAKGEIAAHKVDIVVSRGGTASLLRCNLEIPVFDIYVSGFDLLRAIQPHIKSHRKISVVGYENVVSGAKSIASILGLDLGFFLVTPETDLRARIQEARDWGAEVVIGDTISVRIAREEGILAEIVGSGPETIAQAIDSAADFYVRMQSEMVRSNRLNLILEHSDKGIIYIDSKRTIELVNTPAEKLLRRSRDELIGTDISSESAPSLLHEAIGHGPGEHVIESRGKHLVAEVTPLNNHGRRDSTLLFLQSSSRISELEAMIRKRMTSRGLVAGYDFKDIVGQSVEIRKTIAKAIKYSMTDSTILLLGETGVGKEFFAQSIHNKSTRNKGPFVAVNCAALPDSLLESELFGYADGAFTGARKGGKPGLFEMAHLGTIFLDEVNDMSMKVQSRFLRILQEKQLMRVGDDHLIDIDVRVIAASNKSLIEESNQGTFRKDLYYRLLVLDIEIPPLRDRCTDIMPLILHFLSEFSVKNGYKIPTLPQNLIDALKAYNWPGNIRQLRNFAEKACILFSINEYTEELIDDLIQELQFEGNTHHQVDPSASNHKTLGEIERDIVRRKWEANGRNISKTARDLGLDRATVRKKVVLLSE